MRDRNQAGRYFGQPIGPMAHEQREQAEIDVKGVRSSWPTVEANSSFKRSKCFDLMSRTKSRPTLWRLDQPSNAIASQAVAIPVRWLGRLRVWPDAHIRLLSDGISQTGQAQGRFDMQAF
jgi:hypothetical protein